MRQNELEVKTRVSRSTRVSEPSAQSGRANKPPGEADKPPGEAWGQVEHHGFSFINNKLINIKPLNILFLEYLKGKRTS